MRRTPPDTITRSQFVDLLSTQKAQPVGLVTRTPARMKKTGNPYYGRGIVRVADRHVWIGANYQNMVNRRRAIEGRPLVPGVSPARIAHFRAESLWGGAGRHLPDNPHFVRHQGSGRLYLCFWPMRVIRDLWLDTCNHVIPPEKLRPWLIASGSSDRQGIKDQVAWRVVALENVEILRMNRRIYLVVDDRPAKRQAARPPRKAAA